MDNAGATLSGFAGSFIAIALSPHVRARPRATPTAGRSNARRAARAAREDGRRPRPHRLRHIRGEEAVVDSGPAPLRGRQAVVDAWKRFYTSPTPPFAWEPDAVEALASGTLALSTGPVRDPEGKVVARFIAIWRLESDGAWRVVIDRGRGVRLREAVRSRDPYSLVVGPLTPLVRNHRSERDGAIGRWRC